ncbi:MULTISPECIES: helix-turn-helix domain-containing protein [unclassified Nocardioides]|uniref:helix-turn-helix domain-containing protein n=1 Tax=unclassified Nocardioides TaxID=2615069 RepID=UPI0012E3D63B|nr:MULTISPECIES: helix-turn-helix transcriptional regulator [unclassified Nocardioides]
MALRSMIGDTFGVLGPKKTVIEVARRKAGLSQRQLAEYARTQQSSVSEYESHRKSPTLDVVVRLLEAADAELAVRPMVFWEFIEDSVAGRFAVPDRLWSVPIPECFARVQAWKYTFPPEVHAGWSEEIRTWDLSVEFERIDFYELLLQHGAAPMIEGAVDGVLLIQAWPRMNLPEAIRNRWQPLIDATTATQDGPLHDPGGFNAWMSNEIGVPLPKMKRRRRRPRSVADYIGED